MLSRKRACKHRESLIYFDRVYGVQCSWQICDTCGAEFNHTTLQAPDPKIDDYARTFPYTRVRTV